MCVLRGMSFNNFFYSFEFFRNFFFDSKGFCSDIFFYRLLIFPMVTIYFLLYYFFGVDLVFSTFLSFFDNFFSSIAFV